MLFLQLVADALQRPVNGLVGKSGDEPVKLTVIYRYTGHGGPGGFAGKHRVFMGEP